tara:strand:+ start:15146 stop:15574 length:429 start_codon:yes stop_codon:yes gene_type:complete
MANVIKHKRGTSTPTSSDITAGEILIRTDTGQIFVEGSGSNTVNLIGNAFYSSNLSGNDLDPLEAQYQSKTLSSNTTFTSSIGEGHSMVLLLADGAGYSATWPSGTSWIGGSAPTLPTTGYAVILLWSEGGGSLYGAHVGDL